MEYLNGTREPSPCPCELLNTVADNYITPSKAFNFFHQAYIGNLSIEDAQQEQSTRAAGNYIWRRLWGG